MTPQAEALAALHEVVERLGKPGPLPTVELIVIQSLVTYAISQVENIAVLVRPRRRRATPPLNARTASGALPAPEAAQKGA